MPCALHVILCCVHHLFGCCVHLVIRGIVFQLRRVFTFANGSKIVAIWFVFHFACVVRWPKVRGRNSCRTLMLKRT